MLKKPINKKYLHEMKRAYQDILVSRPQTKDQVLKNMIEHAHKPKGEWATTIDILMGFHANKPSLSFHDIYREMIEQKMIDNNGVDIIFCNKKVNEMSIVELYAASKMKEYFPYVRFDVANKVKTLESSQHTGQNNSDFLVKLPTKNHAFDLKSGPIKVSDYSHVFIPQISSNGACDGILNNPTSIKEYFMNKKSFLKHVRKKYEEEDWSHELESAFNNMNTLLEKPTMENLNKLTELNIKILNLEPKFNYSPEIIIPEIANDKILSLKTDTLNKFENKTINDKEERFDFMMKFAESECAEVKSILYDVLNGL